MSRRERRRARARARDLYVHGIDTARDGAGIAPAPSAPRAFHAMKPALVRATKTSAAIRTRQDLQVICGANGSKPWRPKGKRRVRYTTTVRWDGLHASGPDTGQIDTSVPRGVRILPPGK